MGTKAFLAIYSNEEGTKRWTTILGIASDGVPDNLIYFAREFKKLAEENNIDITKGQEITKTLKEVMANTAELKKYMFLDNVRNATWISYSAHYNPFTGELKVEDLNENIVKKGNIGKVDNTLDNVAVLGGDPVRESTELKTYIELIEKAMFDEQTDSGHLLSQLEKVSTLMDEGEYHGHFEIKDIGPLVRPKLRRELVKLQNSGLQFEELKGMLHSTFIVHCGLDLAHAIISELHTQLHG